MCQRITKREPASCLQDPEGRTDHISMDTDTHPAFETYTLRTSVLGTDTQQAKLGIMPHPGGHRLPDPVGRPRRPPLTIYLFRENNGVPAANSIRRCSMPVQTFPCKQSMTSRNLHCNKVYGAPATCHNSLEGGQCRTQAQACVAERLF